MSVNYCKTWAPCGAKWELLDDGPWWWEILWVAGMSHSSSVHKVAGTVAAAIQIPSLTGDVRAVSTPLSHKAPGIFILSAG